MSVADPIKRILSENSVIAVVGASADPRRPSYSVARYLQTAGFKIVPVNPKLTELFGERSYPDLASIPFPVDIVDIFRNPDAVPAIVEQAIAKRARVVWMQPGAENMQAAERATAAGLQVVMGVCLMSEHRDVSGAGESS